MNQNKKIAISMLPTTEISTKFTGKTTLDQKQQSFTGKRKSDQTTENGDIFNHKRDSFWTTAQYNYMLYQRLSSMSVRKPNDWQGPRLITIY
jgi:hypothetical protein